MKCLRCGNIYEYEAAFCPECGKKSPELTRKTVAKGGAVTTGCGCLFAILPALIMLTQWLQGIRPANESEPGGATPWLFFLTIPIGGITFLLGLIFWLTNIRKVKPHVEKPPQL